MTNAAGAASNINAYDEYGIPAAANAGRFGFAGQAWLPEVSLTHSRARAYAPNAGRFVQTDPIGFAGGMNLYAYVGNDPVNFIDPFGLDKWIVRLDDDIIVTGQRQRPCPAGWTCGAYEDLSWILGELIDPIAAEDIVVTGHRGRGRGLGGLQGGMGGGGPEETPRCAQDAVTDALGRALALSNLGIDLGHGVIAVGILHAGASFAATGNWRSGALGMSGAMAGGQIALWSSASATINGAVLGAYSGDERLAIRTLIDVLVGRAMRNIPDAISPVSDAAVNEAIERFLDEAGLEGCPP